METIRRMAIKLAVGAVALSMLVAGLTVNASPAAAAGALQNRSVTLSSGTAAATGVSAVVSFKVATTSTVQSVEIDLPNFAGGAVTLTAPSNIAGTTIVESGAGATYKIYYNNTSAEISQTTVVGFTLNGLTNPANGNQTVTIKTWTGTSGTGTNTDAGTTLVAIVANSATTVTATVSEALTASIAASSVNLTVDPSGTASQVSSGYAVAVASNAKNGVTTKVSISGDLQGVAYGSSAKIDPVAGTFASGTAGVAGNPPTNKWGITADDGTNWAGPTTSGITVTTLTTASPTNSVSQTHKVGVTVDYTTPADTYTTTIYYVFTPNF